MKFIGLLLLVAFAFSSPTYAKGKESSQANANRDEVRDVERTGKGKGRPDNPGEHGRENAAEKQSRGHGNGSKKDDAEGDKPLHELDGEEKAEGKKQKKDKKK